MLNIYEVQAKEVAISVFREDGFEAYEYDSYRLGVVARSSGHARALAVQFMKADNASVDFLTPMSIRKLSPAWSDAQPDCDWIGYFVHRATAPEEWWF